MASILPAHRGQSLFGRAAIAVPLLLLLGNLSGRCAGAADGGPWFEGLAKPGFYPPGWVFGAAWTILYALMGIAVAVVLAARERGRGLAVALFVIQLALNLAWAPLFFRVHEIGGSVALILAIVVLAILTTWRFATIRRVAGLLMLPYLLWLAFAAVLDARLWALNPGGSRFVENRSVDVLLAQE